MGLGVEELYVDTSKAERESIALEETFEVVESLRKKVEDENIFKCCGCLIANAPSLRAGCDFPTKNSWKRFAIHIHCFAFLIFFGLCFSNAK